jgi:hypothetical protein
VSLPDQSVYFLRAGRFEEKLVFFTPLQMDENHLDSSLISAPLQLKGAEKDHTVVAASWK